MTNLQYGVLYSAVVFIGIVYFVYNINKKLIKEMNEEATGFMVPLVREIKKIKAKPDDDSSKLLLNFSEIGMQNPTYPEHIEILINLNFFNKPGPELYRLKSVITAYAAFYGNKVNSFLVQYNELTSKLYNELEEAYTLVDYQINLTDYVNANSDDTVTNVNAAIYLDSISYGLIMSSYFEWMRDGRKLPHPLFINRNAKVINGETYIDDVMACVTAYSLVNGVRIPKVYLNTGTKTANIVKAILILQQDYQLGLIAKPPVTPTPIRPNLQVVK